MIQLEWEEGSLTVEQAIVQGAAYLEQFALSFSHGTSTALDESAWLVLEALGLSPLDAPDYSLLVDFESKCVAREYFYKRAVERIPVGYITNRTWFAGLEFFVDNRVLIPRSPLAEPILQGFGDFLNISKVNHVLDLCTGSGCIAIACAYAFADAIVDASDISDDALQVAKINIEKHELPSRVKLIKSDVFEGMDTHDQYDLIISNPPYVDKTDMSELTDEFKHEPQLGLAAGDDGLHIVRQILEKAADYLKPDGILVCEVGNSAAALEVAYPELPFLWLQFEYGGEGVFVLTKDNLANRGMQSF